jgi:hypothetical protein
MEVGFRASKGDRDRILEKKQQGNKSLRISIAVEYDIGFRVEAASNTSIVALRVVGGDEKGTQCLGHPVPGGYKFGDLVFQVGGVSNLRQ